MVVPYCLQARFVNSGQLPAVNHVLVLTGKQRCLEMQAIRALPQDDYPTGGRADNEKPGRKDWK